MNNILTNELMNKFSSIKKIIHNPPNLPAGDWLLLEVNPCISNEQNKLILSDIINGEPIYVLGDGSLEHYCKCNASNHEIDLFYNKIAKDIRFVKYKVVIWIENGTNKFCKPLAFVIQPEISLNVFPDHPHINVSESLPDSICYTDENIIKISSAIEQVFIWLYRHEVWIASRKSKNSKWIGEQVITHPYDKFMHLLNPIGLCRCGKNKKYSNCHLLDDYTLFFKHYSIANKHLIEEFSSIINTDNSLNIAKYKIRFDHMNNKKQKLLNEIIKLF